MKVFSKEFRKREGRSSQFLRQNGRCDFCGGQMLLSFSDWNKFPFENAPNLTQRSATLEVPHNIGCYEIEPEKGRRKGEVFEEELYAKLVGRCILNRNA